MTRQQLEQKRAGLEAQMHWAALHRGDQELMDVLHDESGRLLRMCASLSPDVVSGTVMTAPPLAPRQH
jgi:hypothetical protein